MQKQDQNISEQNSNWIKTIKKLHFLIKPSSLFFAVISHSFLLKKNQHSLFVVSDNETIKEILIQYQENIIHEFNKLFNENISTLIVQTINEEHEIIKKHEIISNFKKEEQNENEFDWKYFFNDKAISQIINFINNNDIKLLLITGEANSGKSFLLERILEYLRRNNKTANQYDLSSFNFLVDDTKKENNAFFLIDNIEELSDKKTKNLIYSISLNNNKFIATFKNISTTFIQNLRINQINYISINLLTINKATVDKILKQKIKFTIYPDAYDILLNYLFTNPKEIDNLLRAINLFYEQNNNKIVYKKDIDNILKSLDIDISTKNVDKSINKILSYLNITYKELIGTCRERKYVIARSLVAYYLKNTYDYTFEHISFILKKKSHSTIINLIKYYKNKLMNNLEIKKIINILNIDNNINI